MKAMILAAGLGTRLRPMTDRLPKPLLPMADRPLIEYTLQLLRRYDVCDVIINLHYLGEKIRDCLGDGSRLGMKIRYSDEPQILGTGGGIKRVASYLSDGPFLVINGDILFDLNLDTLLDFHHGKKASATLVLREDPEAAAWGSVSVDAHEQIRQFLGKPDWTRGPLSQKMFSGIHVMEPRVLDYIPDHGFYSIIDAYVEMLKRDEPLAAHLLKGYWTDIGTPERYQKACEDLAEKRVRLSYLQKG